MNSIRTRVLLVAVLLAGTFPCVQAQSSESKGFQRAMRVAEEAFAKGELDTARASLERALERDANALVAWDLRVRLAAAAKDRDEEVYALHRLHELAVAQGAAPAKIKELVAKLEATDPVSGDLASLRGGHLKKLRRFAKAYEELRWPHSAIAVYREILALEPEDAESQAAIERLAAAPDPSLAADASPKDLLADVSNEWISEFDEEHRTWDTRGKLERENYHTQTNAGYEVMVRSAEAMEQMNAFYRRFFRFGTEEDGGSVPRITLRIFRNAEEYRELGSSPAEWSAGQFTGDAVETYVGDAGFEGMAGVLFHEAAHQFVSLATNAAGWLNEGLASFFEGSRLLANGTVLTNLPASHRLLPLARRMESGWMAAAGDGISNDPEVVPDKAPTFRIVLENAYTWGPAWYAPTWGVVYFLYNFQDPRDGRFVYRAAFQEYINKSGGKTGDTAIKTFESVVLGNPAPTTKGTRSSLELPETIDELNAVWKDWILALREEQLGRKAPYRPYREWALHAVTRGEQAVALEHFEKGYAQTPDDAKLLLAFGEYLQGVGNEDRAVKIFRRAKSVIESADELDDILLADADKWLRKVDPQVFKLKEVREELVKDTRAILTRYMDEGLHMMAMELSSRLATELGEASFFDIYETAIEREQGSTALWRLAYNENDLRGWNNVNQELFVPRGETLEATFGEYKPGKFEYRFLTLDTITTGDFSLEAEVRAKYGNVAFAGLTFGQKSAQDFHALILFPPPPGKSGYADLASFYDGSRPDTWRHNPVEDKAGDDPYGAWHRLRIDITGTEVDMWVNDEYVASQTFASPDVLRGRFGLMLSQGKAEFRNVRYLSRNPRDRSGKIERRIRLATDGGLGESLDGSWLGRKPPFPTTQHWVGEPRTSWEEFAGYPQLLVIWECSMNEFIRIDQWLNSVHEQYAPLGLKIVSVVSPFDRGRIENYLKEKPFPGPVAVDQKKDRTGHTFTAYRVDKFFLPRVILIDVDGKVLWEGDPGLHREPAWAGEPTTLDTPLAEVMRTRRMAELKTWRENWAATGTDALAQARFVEVLPLLREAASFEAALYPDAGAVGAELSLVYRALDDIAGTLERLGAEGREPALDVLLDWAKALGADVNLPSKDRKVLERSAPFKDWKRALAALKPLSRKVEAGKEPGDPAPTLERLAELEGTFVQELRAALAEAPDQEALAGIVRAAEAGPALWLATEFFGWGADSEARDR